jgi:hypothetical protein
MPTKPPKPDVVETGGWKWVRVSDDLLDQLREYGDPVRVKVEDGAEPDEVVLTFQKIEEGR